MVALQIWEDYAVVKCGQRTKREMEKEDGPAWRRGDKKYFHSRQFIFSEIEKIATAECVSHVEAAKLLEQRRKEVRVHITALQNVLKSHGEHWMQHAVPQWPASD